MTTIPHPHGRHRAPRPAPVRLTRRGRMLRNLTAGAVACAVALFAQYISVGFFTVVVWAGQVTGLSA